MTIQAQIKKRDWTVHPKASSTQPLIPLKHTLSELTGPVFGHNAVKKIEADLKHGVLTLRLPKTPEVKPIRIQVKA